MAALGGCILFIKENQYQVEAEPQALRTPTNLELEF